MKKKLKIALLTYSTRSRGGVVHTTHLADELQKRGHDVHLFALGPPTEFYRKVDVPFTVINVEQNLVEDFPSRVKKYIDAYVKEFSQNPKKFDIYHTQDCVSGNALLKLKDTIHPIIRTIHHVDTFRHPYLIKCQEDSIINSDYRIVVSKEWQNYIKMNYQFDSKVIYNGVNPDRYSPNIDAHDFIEKLDLKNKFVFSFLGGIEPRKGTIYLIRAMKKVVEKIENAVLVIAGTKGIIDYSEYQENFYKEFKELNIENHVKIIGRVSEEDLPKLYKASDCFVFPSLCEGWGLAPMEAISCGTPVISSNIECIKEFLINEKNALLVEPEDSLNLADAMIRIFNDGDLRKNLNIEGRKTALNYSWEKTAKDTEQLYYDILRNGRF